MVQYRPVARAGAGGRIAPTMNPDAYNRNFHTIKAKHIDQPAKEHASP